MPDALAVPQDNPTLLVPELVAVTVAVTNPTFQVSMFYVTLP